jgi:uncharacterized protein (DUF736 family)
MAILARSHESKPRVWPWLSMRRSARIAPDHVCPPLVRPRPGNGSGGDWKETNNGCNRFCERHDRRGISGSAEDAFDPREITPNRSKSGDAQPDYRVFSEGVEIGAGWLRTGEVSGRDYVSLSLAAPEFGPRRLYANLGRAAGQDDGDTYAVIWNPAD